MSDHETDRRMAELERLLNDPEVRLDPHRVWALLAEIRLRLAGPRGAQPLSMSTTAARSSTSSLLVIAMRSLQKSHIS